MPSPQDVAEQEKRRRRRWLWILPLAGIALLYGVSYALTYTDRYERVPASAWRSMDFDAIAAAASDSAGDSPLVPGDSASGRAASPPAPPQVREAADRWVRAINEANPQAILYHEADGYGNLYVVVGAWWDIVGREGQFQALDNLGRYWRSYLHDAFGQWPTESRFAPGIVIVDSLGQVGHNMNGEVALRRPSPE